MKPLMWEKVWAIATIKRYLEPSKIRVNDNLPPRYLLKFRIQTPTASQLDTREGPTLIIFIRIRPSLVHTPNKLRHSFELDGVSKNMIWLSNKHSKYGKRHSRAVTWLSLNVFSLPLCWFPKSRNFFCGNCMRIFFSDANKQEKVSLSCLLSTLPKSRSAQISILDRWRVRKKALRLLLFLLNSKETNWK